MVNIIIYYIIIIFWDRCRICGPSLTETLLCSACLYCKRIRDKLLLHSASSQRKKTVDFHCSLTLLFPAF